jgi:kinesin family protein C2/C3
MLAASWLQEMVGITSLPNELSEEEFRLCLRNGLILCNAINKVHPGAVPKVCNLGFLFIPNLKAQILIVATWISFEF